MSGPLRLFPPAALVAAVLSAPSAALAAWPTDPTVNLGLTQDPPLITCCNVGTQPVTVPDGAGGAYAFWTDYHTGSAGLVAGTHVLADGSRALGWSADGNVLDYQTSSAPVAIADGTGGVYVVWQETGTGVSRLVAEKLNPDGSHPSGWAATGGVPVSVEPNGQLNPKLALIGTDLCVVFEYAFSSTDHDIYAQRLNAAGAPQWSIYGTGVCTHGAFEANPSICKDAAGGVIVAWEDNRNGTKDIYAQRLAPNGVARWMAQGAPVSTTAGDQTSPAVAGDLHGGVYLGWEDTRYGAPSVFGQRFDSTGAIPPSLDWPSAGIQVSPDAMDPGELVVLPDGAGGVYFAWTGTGQTPTGLGYVPKAARYVEVGMLASGWPLGGRPISTFANLQNQFYVNRFFGVAPDGSGGLVFVWPEDTGLTPDNSFVYAQRVTSTGANAVGWPDRGAAICTETLHERRNTVLAPDGTGGFVAVWDDERYSALGSNVDTPFAQRVDGWGKLGNSAPALTAVADVAKDQGGKVRVQWTRSPLDTATAFEIDAYDVWQRVPAAIAETRLAQGARLVRAGERPVATGAIRERVALSQVTYWSYLASVPARGFAAYSLDVATPSDSMPGYNPYDVYMVDASDRSFAAFWDSAPDSGYSVDNLAPATPAPFVGAYVSGVTHLHWGPNPETDFSHYALYRGSTATFLPGPGNLVVSQPDTGFADAAGPPAYYKLAAVDVHGNASPYALLAPSSTTDVPAPGVAVLSLAAPRPDPSRGPVELGFALSRTGPASVALFDPQGRQVSVLADGTFPAGEHRWSWDARAAGAELPAGVYFLRLSAEGRTITRRLTLLR